MAGSQALQQKVSCGFKGFNELEVIYRIDEVAGRIFDAIDALSKRMEEARWFFECFVKD